MMKAKKGYLAGMLALTLAATTLSGCAGGTGSGAGSEGESTADEKVRDSGIQMATSYDEIFACLENSLNADEEFGGDIAIEEELAVEDSMAIATSSGKDTGAAESYSSTNIRQEGVDEADIVKNDGRYIYTLRDSGKAVSIIDTKDGLKKVVDVEPENLTTIFDIFIHEQNLVVIGEREIKPDKGDQSYIFRSNTVVMTYDLSDMSNPVKAGEITQSGSYTTSRMVDGELYLFSQYGMCYGLDFAKEDVEQYIPMINDTVLPAADIYLPVENRGCIYEIVSSISMDQPGALDDSKAIFTNGGQLYMSNDNIYWYETNWSGKSTTKIRKLSYKDGEVEAKAYAEVPGHINDSFSIDEYDGYLRVITTDDDVNDVFVLDENMEIVGEIKGLAKDERVYSARMFGDTGYFVTYRETDPLFSVDFSDPTNPQILGELKIPGFSEYLHFYGEDKLLGIGMDMDDTGMTSDGMKLSMFDISDKTDVKEIAKYVMENVYNADVMYDYKVALVEPEQNLIGFSAYTEGGENYYLFSYEDGEGFICNLEEYVNGNDYRAARGVRINKELYVVKGNVIEGYSLSDYSKIEDLIL